MTRRLAVLLGAASLGVAVAFGCSADLRNLNGCRAAAAAVCDRNRDCDEAGFDETFPSLDACSEAFLSILDKGRVPSGPNTCGDYKSDCLDAIESAPCGRTTVLEECGVLRSISPGVGGGGPARDGGSDARHEGGLDLTTLTAGPPDVLELRGGVLVACKAGQGCRSSSGDTYGGSDAKLVSFAVDSLRNVYGADADHELSMITPDGVETVVGGGYETAFSVPMSESSIGVAFTGQSAGGTFPFFVLAPGQTRVAEARDPGELPAAVSGFAAIERGYALSAGQSVVRCPSSAGPCSPIAQFSSPVLIRGVEGPGAGVRFVGISEDGVFLSEGSTRINVSGLEDCEKDVVMVDETIGCITRSQAVLVNGAPVPGATDVAKLALDASEIHWVTAAGEYHHAARSSPVANDE
jgi:hypothetical protein